jgi:hypothetical protein
VKRLIILATLALLFIASLAGAAEGSSVEFRPPVLSNDLKDCKFFTVKYPVELWTLRVLYIVKCPNSTTSTTTADGKMMQTVTVSEKDK